MKLCKSIFYLFIMLLCLLRLGLAVLKQILAELPEAEAITNDSSSNDSGHFMNRLNSSASTISEGEHSEDRHSDVKALSGMKRKSENNQPASIAATLAANGDFVNKPDDMEDREVSFGRYVAARLKRIRSGKIKHQVEKMIMDAIYDGEMCDSAEPNADQAKFFIVQDDGQFKLKRSEEL